MFLLHLKQLCPRMHSVGRVGWILLIPQVGILGQDTLYLDKLYSHARLPWLNGTGLKRVSFLQGKYPDRGHREQRSTLWFYRQRNEAQRREINI